MTQNHYFNVNCETCGRRSTKGQLCERVATTPPKVQSVDEQFAPLTNQELAREISYEIRPHIEVLVEQALTTRDTALREAVEKYAGKVYGFEVIVNEEPDNEAFNEGFAKGKAFMKEQILTLLDNKNYEE